MNYGIITITNKIIKTKKFKKLNKEEQIEIVLNNIKEIISKLLISYQININEEEKLSEVVLKLNEFLDYGIKQEINQELSHAILNALMAIEKHDIEWTQTTDKHLRLNPIITYDLNMTLQSIKTYNEMDLGKLSVLLIKTVEGNIENVKKYKLTAN